MQKAGLLFIKFGVALLSFFPFRAIYLLSDGLAFFFLHIIKYRRKIVAANLRNAFPEKQPSEIKRFEKEFYHHFSDLLLETIKGLTMKKEEMKARFVYKNPEIFTSLFEKNQSALLLGSHFGNWEWGVLSFPLAVQHKVVGIYKPLKNKVLDNYLNTLRKKWGLQLAPMNQAGRAIIQNKNEPTIYVLIADQTPSDVKNAHWLEFLRQDTPFHHGAEKLAKQTGYPVFMFHVQKVKRGYYEVTFSELTHHPKQMGEGKITALFAKKLEETIQEKPAHWLWSHRRWKRKRAL